MLNLKLNILLLATSCLVLSTLVRAGAIYSADSIATIGLNSDSPEDISFVNVLGNYGGLAAAISDGSIAIDSAGGPFNRSGSFASLGELLFPFTSIFPSPFDSVNAVIGGQKVEDVMKPLAQ